MEGINSKDREIGWNDTINGESVPLPEGDYIFTVAGFERGRYPGGDRIPPCNMARLTLRVSAPDFETDVRTSLFLCTSQEWRLAAFFRCIGQKKSGERLVPDWTKVEGSRGRARFAPRAYTDKNGGEHTVNSVARWYDWEEEYFPPEPPAVTELPEDEQLPF